MKNTDKKQGISQEARALALVTSVAAVVREGLHELVVRSGLGVVGAMLEADREALCGPRYEHSEHNAHRAGHIRGELAMGGRRVEVKRPRVRSVEGRELPLPTWEHFAGLDPLGERAYEQMLVGVATRRYARSLEPLGAGVKARGTSKSAVSRRFVAATAARVEEQLTRPLDDLKLAVLMMDGIHFGEHVILVALGIDESGKKHVVGLREGATENAASCTALLTNLVERGLDTTRSRLVVIDGGKALRRAVREVFGQRSLVQRCQLHKKRNVLDQLPERMRASVSAALSQAYPSREKAMALRLLHNLERAPREGTSRRGGVAARGPRRDADGGRPRSAARARADVGHDESDREPQLGRAPRVRTGHALARWRDDRALDGRAMSEAAKGFRRLKGHAGMPLLLAWLRRNDETIDGEAKLNVGAA